LRSEKKEEEKYKKKISNKLIVQ